jgi:hypothetical protein
VLTALILSSSCSSEQQPGSSQVRVISAQQKGGPVVNLSDYNEAEVPELLDDYANQLKASGRTADAAKVSQQASADAQRRS